MRRLLSLALLFVALDALLATAAVALAGQGPVSPSQAGHEFKLGFKALADLLPDVVGRPVADEHWSPSGASLQRTTTGLMVWRSRDNWTGFTDGSSTWILGPFGVSVRGNDERFPWEARPPLTFGEPFGYCSAVGTVDRPDDRYVGPPVISTFRNEISTAFQGSRPEGFNDRNSFWRCMDGRLLVCTVGANLNCGQADLSTEPTAAMAKYCQDNPNAQFIPLAVAGHSGIYAWQCREDRPAIARQTFTVDPRGFVAELWRELSPPGGQG